MGHGKIRPHLTQKSLWSVTLEVIHKLLLCFEEQSLRREEGSLRSSYRTDVSLHQKSVADSTLQLIGLI